MRLDEKNLLEILEKFNNKNVTLIVGGTITMIINIQKLKIEYISKQEIIHITDKKNNLDFKIDMIPLLDLKITDDTLFIKLDNYIEVYLRID